MYILAYVTALELLRRDSPPPELSALAAGSYVAYIVCVGSDCVLSSAS